MVVSSVVVVVVAAFVEMCCLDRETYIVSFGGHGSWEECFVVPGLSVFRGLGP